MLSRFIALKRRVCGERDTSLSTLHCPVLFSDCMVVFCVSRNVQLRARAGHLQRSSGHSSVFLGLRN
ncbi:hypothetical protein RRG08_005456 [Elysia crispata]|uniref:Uncharacterized protein n=1 Tax=Elysia crispata TaxID=231223 RepID=A0AAE1CQV7_9GAST|nr:hypothetical protein RRG08_005456 [Elysia crispata]